MAMSDLQELLKHDLGDLYFAEKTILKALKKQAREVSNPEMRARIEAHQGETEQQIANLEQAFQAIGAKAKAEKCPGILGIIQEHDEFKSEEEPSKQVLEAFALGSGLRIEHYEIAAYRGAIALARTLGQRQVVDLLKANLEQEVAMARFLEGSAVDALKLVRQQAAGGEGRGAAKRGAAKDGAASGGTATRGAAKGGARGAGASKRAATKRGSRSAAGAA